LTALVLLALSVKGTLAVFASLGGGIAGWRLLWNGLPTRRQGKNNLPGGQNFEQTSPPAISGGMIMRVSSRWRL